MVAEGDSPAPDGLPEAPAPDETTSHVTNDLLEPLRDPDFAEPLEHLEQLLSQPNCAFLLAAGCSKHAGLPLMPELTKRVLEAIPTDDKALTILEAVIANFQGSRAANIEDYMSELVDLISLAERRNLRAATTPDVHLVDKQYSVDDLKETLTAIKDRIATCITDCTVSIDTHRSFVRAIHSILGAGKARAKRTVNYFVLNYDTLLEDALSLERTAFVDGFSGGATAWWHEDAYRDSKAQARVFKVHGSIDWCLWEHEVLPRRIRVGLPVAETSERVLIWPAATKYRETQRDPYAQIIDLMRQALRPTDGSEVVLTVCGYSFGDEHINTEIDRALRESEQGLTLVAFTSDDEPTGQLRTWLDNSALREQVRVHANHGLFHGPDVIRSKTPLPWWRFEVLARLLGGER